MTELTLKADRHLAAEHGRDMHFLLLSFRAPRMARTAQRPGINLSVVLDRSGSMAAANKLTLAVKAAKLALARLTAKDRFSVVTYDDVSEVLVPSVPATPEALNEARNALNRVIPGQSTALFDGYLRGAEQVAEHLVAGALGKVLLLTDGLANVGLQDPVTISEHVAELRSRGVLTSTFGVGADFNQLLLDGMAMAGGGNFYFLENASQLEDLLTSEVGEALETVARDVRVVVEHPQDVRVHLLDAFAAVPNDGRLTTQLGPLTSEQVVELLYEIELPGRPAGELSRLRFAVADADGALGASERWVEFRHASDAEVDAEPANADIVRRAANRVRLEATERVYAANYQGRLGEVRLEASRALEYLTKLANKYPELAKLIEELELDVANAEMPMSAMMAKMMYFKQSRSRRGRDAFGKASKESS